jgi:hypothetical protein
MEHPLIVVNGTKGVSPKGTAGAQPGRRKSELSMLLEAIVSRASTPQGTESSFWPKLEYRCNYDVPFT